jgi:hypothetical protein
MKRRLPGQRNESAVGALRRDIESKLLQAKEAGIVDAEIDRPLWTEIIKPMIEEQLEEFSRSCWDKDMDPEAWQKMQSGCRALMGLRDYVEGLAGVREQIMQEVRTLSSAVELAESEGLVDKEVPADA